ncbi:hypothetical protein HZH66_007791 [Vespula vulgaris]|uniref:Uncharacterized protein n=1 Tax=Vespula vulgaris TaxID=7454 RepID=A0A834JVV0_VESVU|nr:hypothetical protein HZH66_007791 [Vespula vulgaris]
MEDAQLVRRVCSKCSTNGQNTTRLAVCFGMALVDKPNATSRGVQEEEEEQEQQQQQQQQRARGWRNCTRSLARALNES